MAILSAKSDENCLKEKVCTWYFEFKCDKKIQKKSFQKNIDPLYIGPNLSLYNNNRKKND